MNRNCDQSSHKDDVDVVNASICNTINVSSKELIDDNRTVQRHNIAGWNDNVKHLHTAAREAYLLWIYSGKPIHGERLMVLLSILLSAILIHGYVPTLMIKSVMVPIIKNKNKRITDREQITVRYAFQVSLANFSKMCCIAG